LFYFLDLLSHDTMVERYTVELAHNLSGLINAALAISITWRLGEKHGAEPQDERPG
jgi:hypothetical protein